MPSAPTPFLAHWGRASLFAPMSYADKLKDPRWQKKRLQILERDEFTCRDCGAKDKTLHVHHCHYDRRDPWEMEDSLLLTLCEDCHESRGDLEATAKLCLARIMARLCHAPDDFELSGFVETLAKVSEAVSKRGEDDESYCDPIMCDLNDVEYVADMRWFHYAWEHPEARPAYMDVIGRRPKWPAEMAVQLEDNEWM